MTGNRTNFKTQFSMSFKCIDQLTGRVTNALNILGLIHASDRPFLVRESLYEQWMSKWREE